MAGLFGLLFLFLFVILTLLLFRYGRKRKRTRFPRKDLLPGYDFSKGSAWKSSSMTKGNGENPLKVAGESHDQDALEKIFRPSVEKDEEKKDVVTIIVEEDNSEG